MIIRSTASYWFHALKLIRNYPWRQRFKVLVDYRRLYQAKGLTANEYYTFEFERRKETFKDSFLGVREQRFYLELLNPINYYILARNKYMTHKLLDAAGVPMPFLYCYYQPEGSYYDSEECGGNLIDVLRILKDKNVLSCVVKETENSHGEGVLVVKKIEYLNNDALLICSDDKRLLLSSVLGKEALVFEGLVKQTEQFANFNESSVNTVRFMTTLWPDGTARVIATFIKIGREGKSVDNAGDGGNIDVCIDVETGELKYAIQFDGWRRIKSIERHPDSGNQLNGVIIQNWNDIKSRVVQFQQSFPFCKAAGWDIAITDRGPVVIEVNDMWDRTGQYFIRRGWRKEIRDCYIAWKSEGYKVWRGRSMNDFSETKCWKLYIG